LEHGEEEWRKGKRYGGVVGEGANGGPGKYMLVMDGGEKRYTVVGLYTK
jgi:hypothetical protein